MEDLTMKGVLAFAIGVTMVHGFGGGREACALAPQESQEMPLASSVQRILGITPADADILKPLERTIAVFRQFVGITDTKGEAYKKQIELLDRLTDELVEALNQGARPDALAAVLLPEIHIENSGRFPAMRESWKYGTFGDRLRLQNHLWKKARQLATTDPKKAASYSRGTVLLASHDVFTMGWSVIYSIGRQLGNYSGLIGIDGRQAQELSKLAEPLYKQQEEQTKKDVVAMMAIDSISDQPEPSLPAGNLEKAISALRACWASKKPSLWLRWGTANLAWQLMSLARDRKSQDSIGKIEQLVKTWADETQEADLKRWLNEVLEHVGPPPGRMYGRYVMRPDGKIVPDESKDEK
jgi:hypothetical protein